MAEMQHEVLKRTRLQNVRHRNIFTRKKDATKYTTVSQTRISKLEECLNVVPKSLCVLRVKRRILHLKEETETKTFLKNQTRAKSESCSIRTIPPRYIDDDHAGSRRGNINAKPQNTGGVCNVRLEDGENIARSRQLVDKIVKVPTAEAAKESANSTPRVNINHTRSTKESADSTPRVNINQARPIRAPEKCTEQDSEDKVAVHEPRPMTTPVAEKLPVAVKCRGSTRRVVSHNISATLLQKENNEAKTSNNNNNFDTQRPKFSRVRCKTSMGFRTEPELRTTRTTKSAGFLRYRHCTDWEGSTLTESGLTNLATQLEVFVTESNMHKFQSVFLSCDPDTRQKIAGYKADSHSSSVFFRACQLSRIAFVSVMLEECIVDLEQTGVFHVPDDGDSTIFQVTPLWQAAASCNLDLARLLISSGANINAISSTGCTVVRAACCVASFAIVSFLIAQGADIHARNEYGVTCLMNAITNTEITKLLIHHGSKISQADIKGNTVLHYAAETGRLDTVKLLVEMGANPLKCNLDNCNAIQCAAMYGHRDVVDYLLKAASPSLEDMADIFLLLGSVCIIMDPDYSIGYLDWHKALELKRLGTRVSRNRFRTCVFNNNIYSSVLSEIAEIQEIQAVDELSINHYDRETLFLQALLVYERIRGALDNNFIHLLMFRGAASADQRNFKLAINLCKIAYKLRLQKCLDKGDIIAIVDMFNNSLISILRLLLKIVHETFQEQIYLNVEMGAKEETMLVSEDIIMDLFRTVCGHIFQANDDLKQNKNEDKRVLGSFTFLLRACLSICYVYLIMFPATNRNPGVARQLQKLIQLNPRGVNNETLLHLCLDGQLSPPCQLDSRSFGPAKQPSLVLMEVLLLLGANPLAQDCNGNTVLHLAARLHRQGRPLDPSLLRMMLRLGVHADQVNHQALTPLHFLPAVADLRHALQQASLKCLAARVIVRHKIPYIGEVPISLYSFIELHAK